MNVRQRKPPPFLPPGPSSSASSSKQTPPTNANDEKFLRDKFAACVLPFLLEGNASSTTFRPDSKPLPIKFNDVKHYKSSFEPLLFLNVHSEIRERILSRAEQDNARGVEILDVRLSESSMTRHLKSDGYALCEVTVNNAGSFKEWDIIQLNTLRESSPNRKRNRCEGLSGAMKHFLDQLPAFGLVRKLMPAKVERNELMVGKIWFLLRRESLQLDPVDHLLAGNLKPFSNAMPRGFAVVGKKVKLNLVTPWREWKSLQLMDSQISQYLLICLLDPTASKGAVKEGIISKGSCDVTQNEERLERHLHIVGEKCRLNKYQLGAMRSVGLLTARGIEALFPIQGPPGTGKTTMLISMLNVLHNASTQAYFAKIVNASCGPNELSLGGDEKFVLETSDNKMRRDTCKGRESTFDRVSALITSQAKTAKDAQLGAACTEDGDMGGSSLPQLERGCRILVCTSSNGAIDEIVTRLVSRKVIFWDEKGRDYMPSIVRVGEHCQQGPCTLDARSSELKSMAVALCKDGNKNVEKRIMRQLQHIQAKANKQRQQRRRSLSNVQKYRIKVQSIEKEYSRISLSTSEKEMPNHEPMTIDLTVDNPSEYNVMVNKRRISELDYALSQAKDALANDLSAAEEAEKKIVTFAEEKDKCLIQLHAIHCLDERHRGTFDAKKPAPHQTHDAFLTREERRRFEELALKQAHIVFTTSSSAADRRLELLESGLAFETVVLDEAAQLIELSSLISMSLGARLVVLVGDSRQLPATVVSETARRLGYARSLFERLEEAGHPSAMLRIQYRMHPAICRFPSSHFYSGKLICSEKVRQLAKVLPGLIGGPPAFLASELTSRRLAPYVFFNIMGSSQKREESSHSLRNEREASFCVKLCRMLRQVADSLEILDFPGSVLILTPYLAQVAEIKRQLHKYRVPPHNLAVGSVDSSQGREADVVIYSCVRANPHGGVGFVADVRRMNVAITRARHALYIVGSKRTLQGSKDWAALLQDAQGRHECWRDICDESLPLKQLLKEFPTVDVG